MAKLRGKRVEGTMIELLNEAPMSAWIRSGSDGPKIAPGVDLFCPANPWVAADVKLWTKR